MKDIDEQIAKAASDLQTLLSQMEEVKQGLEKEAAVSVSAWYMSIARREVESQTQITEKLSDDQLSRIKKAVKSLQDKTESLVSACLDRDDLWWHKSRGNQNYSCEKLRPPDGLQEALRPAGQELLPLLNKFGYVTQFKG